MARALLLGSLLLLGFSVRAERVETAVVVLEADGRHSERSMTTWLALVNVLRTSEPRLRVVGAEAQAVEQTLAEDAATKGLAALKNVKRLLHEGDVRGAGAAADEALGHLERADWRSTHSAFIEALAWKGALLERQAELSFLFTIEPTYEFAPGAIPERAMTEVRLQRSGKEKALRGTIPIESTQPTFVWVDGRFAGVTPLASPVIVAGRHLITTLVPGEPLLQSVELLTPGTPLRLSSAPTERGQALRSQWAELAAGVRRGLPQLPPGFSPFTKTSQTILVVLQDGGAEVWRLTQHGSTGQRVSKPSTESLASTVGALQDTSPKLAAETKLQAQQSSASAMPFLLIGSGVALAVLGGVSFAFSRGDLAAAQAVPLAAAQEYEHALARARLTAYSSYALFGAAAVSVGTGIAWWVSSRTSTNALAFIVSPTGVSVSGGW